MDDRNAHAELPRALPRDRPSLAALLALAGLPSISPRRLWALLERDEPIAAWSRVERGASQPGRLGEATDRWRRHASRVDPNEVLEAHDRAGIAVTPYGCPSYPQRLSADPDPPALLLRRGSGSPLDGVAVAVVGTRRCTRYGREIAHELGASLAAHGIDVVSGLAHGIDAAAHAGARTADASRCVGVVGSGLDVVYPRGNTRLWAEVAATGTLLSEWPLGSPALPWRFPARNRIVASLAAVTVVVESAERGGSMYTVDEALRRDRSVFAVPGSIRSPASAGTNRLIADGAEILCSIEALVETLAPGVPQQPSLPLVAEAASPSWLLDLLGWEPASVERIVADSGRGPSDVVLEIERQLAAGTVARSGARIERIR